jgi:hypothetical protein
MAQQYMAPKVQVNMTQQRIASAVNNTDGAALYGTNSAQ